MIESVFPDRLPSTGDNIHFIAGNEGNSFVFKRIAIFPETKSGETSGFDKTVSRGTSKCFVIQLELSVELKE